METRIRKYVITFSAAKSRTRATFFERAKKHIIPKKKGVSKRLSQNIDKALYGA